jgi:hypothetical protein
MRKPVAPKSTPKATPKVLKSTFTSTDLQWAFNEWMRRYIKNPEGFEREFQSVQSFQSSKGKPSYGKDCTRYLTKLLVEKDSKKRKR